MEMDRPHTKTHIQQHHQTLSRLESASLRQKEEQTNNHMETNHKGRIERMPTYIGRGKESSKILSQMEGYCGGPMTLLKLIEQGQGKVKS